MKPLHLSLLDIQQELRVPKDKKNNFADFKYRNLEAIEERVKPLLMKHELTLTFNDELVELAGSVYVKATATFKDGNFEIKNTAFAREEETKKGMDASQITGSTSSYARKYALNGLFLIDDVKDADTDENKQEQAKKEPKQEPVKMATPEQLKELEALEVNFEQLCKAFKLSHLNELTFDMAEKAIAKKKEQK